MPEKNIPTDATPSQGTFEVFQNMFGDEIVDGWAISLETGWRLEVICLSAIGVVTEVAYTQTLSAIGYAEMKLKQGGPRCLECCCLSGHIYKLCDQCFAFVERAKVGADARV